MCDGTGRDMQGMSLFEIETYQFCQCQHCNEPPTVDHVDVQPMYRPALAPFLIVVRDIFEGNSA